MANAYAHVQGKRSKIEVTKYVKVMKGMDFKLDFKREQPAFTNSERTKTSEYVKGKKMGYSYQVDIQF